MSKLIKHLFSNRKIIFDRGKFDDWCVYVVEENGKKRAPYDTEYFSDLKEISKNIGANNALALELFDSGIYEARILCSKIYDPELITEEQMDNWVATFENWEICDSFCMGFFAKSKFAIPKAIEWSNSEDEFIKRAGFVIMACYGFADKYASNEVFEQFFPMIEREAKDHRVYVKKAVNWALRNIGKRNIDLNTSAILMAEKILTIDDKIAGSVCIHSAPKSIGTAVKSSLLFTLPPNTDDASII